MNGLVVPLGVAAYLLGTMAVATLLRIRVWGLHFGIGPVLAQRSWRHLVLALRPLPIAGHVRFDPPEEESADAHQRIAPPGRSFALATRLERTLLYLAGPAALVAVASVVLGPDIAIISFRRGFGQILAGALDPLTTGPAHLRALGNLVFNSSFTTCLAVVAAKMAALNLLPIPPLNGFQALHALLFRSHEGVWLLWVWNMGALLVLLIVASYTAALVVVLWFS